MNKKKVWDYLLIIAICVLIGYMFAKPYLNDYTEEYRCRLILPVENVTCMYMVDGICYHSCTGDMVNMMTVEEVVKQCKTTETYCKERYKVEVLKDAKK